MATSAGLRRHQQERQTYPVIAPETALSQPTFPNSKASNRQSLIYVEEAAKAGRSVQRGEKQNIVRWLHIADSEEHYNEKLRK